MIFCTSFFATLRASLMKALIRGTWFALSPDSYTANGLTEHVLRFVFDLNTLQEEVWKDTSNPQLGEFGIFMFLLCARTQHKAISWYLRCRKNARSNDAMQDRLIAVRRFYRGTFLKHFFSWWLFTFTFNTASKYFHCHLNWKKLLAFCLKDTNSVFFQVSYIELIFSSYLTLESSFRTIGEKKNIYLVILIKRLKIK